MSRELTSLFADQDLLTLNLTANPTYSSPSSSTTENVLTRAPFVCPLSLKEMSGAVPFVALRPCGCVFSDVSIRALVPTLTKGVAATVLPKDDLPEEAKPVVDGEKADIACPNCGNPFDPTLPTSIQPINPTREVQEDLLENLLIARAAAKSSSKKRKIVGITPSVPVTEEQPAKIPRNTSSPIPRTSSASPAPGMRDSPKLAPTSLARSVHQKLAEQEQKRLVAQAGMSDAVRAMFKPKEKGADHHKGNADFFGRTFTRVSL